MGEDLTTMFKEAWRKEDKLREEQNRKDEIQKVTSGPDENTLHELCRYLVSAFILGKTLSDKENEDRP